MSCGVAAAGGGDGSNGMQLTFSLSLDERAVTAVLKATGRDFRLLLVDAANSRCGSLQLGLQRKPHEEHTVLEPDEAAMKGGETPLSKPKPSPTTPARANTEDGAFPRNRLNPKETCETVKKSAARECMSDMTSTSSKCSKYSRNGANKTRLNINKREADSEKTSVHPEKSRSTEQSSHGKSNIPDSKHAAGHRSDNSRTRETNPMIKDAADGGSHGFKRPVEKSKRQLFATRTDAPRQASSSQNNVPRKKRKEVGKSTHSRSSSSCSDSASEAWHCGRVTKRIKPGPNNRKNQNVLGLQAVTAADMHDDSDSSADESPAVTKPGPLSSKKVNKISVPKVPPAAVHTNSTPGFPRNHCGSSKTGPVIDDIKREPGIDVTSSNHPVPSPRPEVIHSTRNEHLEVAATVEDKRSVKKNPQIVKPQITPQKPQKPVASVPPAREVVKEEPPDSPADVEVVEDELEDVKPPEDLNCPTPISGGGGGSGAVEHVSSPPVRHASTLVQTPAAAGAFSFRFVKPHSVRTLSSDIDYADKYRQCLENIQNIKVPISIQKRQGLNVVPASVPIKAPPPHQSYQAAAAAAASDTLSPTTSEESYKLSNNCRDRSKRHCSPCPLKETTNAVPKRPGTTAHFGTSSSRNTESNFSSDHRNDRRSRAPGHPRRPFFQQRRRHSFPPVPINSQQQQQHLASRRERSPSPGGRKRRDDRGGGHLNRRPAPAAMSGSARALHKVAQKAGYQYRR